MHAPLTQKDLDLHSFFSGHRPLLLLSQPSSSVFESWPNLRLSNNPDPAASRHQSLLNQLGGINLEDPPEATPEADADAARLLNRALVVNRLGGSVSWEETLAKLGAIEERMSLSEMGMGAHDVVDASMMDGFNAYMESTKRKKRKKMKKHKLKKRRRVRWLCLPSLRAGLGLTPIFPAFSCNGHRGSRLADRPRPLHPLIALLLL